jgi:RimJ/RimL family protein N-acetyltransferase
MIFGDRIRLRSTQKDDIPKFVEWLNKPDVITGLSIFLPISIESEEIWFTEMMKSSPEEHPLVIEILENDSWEMIGNIGFSFIDYRIRSTEIGIFIGEIERWNKGYGTKAMKTMLKHGFETLNLNRIMLRVFANNHNAIRVYEKIGFQHEGRLRQATFINGEYIDVLIMSVLASEWVEFT